MENWLPPSITNKINSHLYIIDQLHKILPITQIIVEVASFDIERIKEKLFETNQIDDELDYLTFQNIRAFVLYRDRYLCQHCKGKSKDKKLEVHHIESRKTGGNSPNNLITVCSVCHKKHHDSNSLFQFTRGSSFRDATFMNILKSRIVKLLREKYRNVKLTYGFQTSYTRNLIGLEKEHYNDAFCIAGYTSATKLKYFYKIVKTRCHNRKIHLSKFIKGGIRKRNQASFEVFGFRLFDKVDFQGNECFIYGRRERGAFEIRKLDGETIKAGVTYKKLKLVERKKIYLTQRVQIKKQTI